MTKPLSSLYFERPKYLKSAKDTWKGFPWAGISYFAYARQAFINGLRQLGVKPGSSILFPEFICRDLLSVANELNASIFFYPVNETFQPALDPSSWPKADVVLAVNYFGFAQPLEPFREFCQRTGALLVEDNAHGFLSKSSEFEWLGTRADIGIFSFRKTLPMGTGAGLYFKSVTPAIQQPKSSIPFKSSISQAIKNSLAQTVCRIPLAAKALVGVLQSGSPGLTGDWMTDSIICENFIPQGNISNTELPELLQSVDFREEIKRRRLLYERLTEAADRHNEIRIVMGPLDAHTCPYMFVFTSKNQKSLLGFIDYTLGQGLRFIRWPDLPLAVRGNCPDFYKNIWAVPFMW